MSNWRNVLLGAVLGLVVHPANAGDCDLGARYFSLGKQAEQLSDDSRALGFFERAADQCARYEYWQALGELAATFGEVKQVQAAEAYIQAYEVAIDDRQRARAAARYADLLFVSGDPQRAEPIVYHARNLDPSAQWIGVLAARVSARVREGNKEDMKRGLGDAFLPMMITQKSAGPAESASLSSGGGSSSAARSIRIPLHFEFDSTTLVAGATQNLPELAETLADEQFADMRFQFVGHADVRGEDAYNMKLSVDRANAIYDWITARNPALASRISVGAKGESDPISHGTSEQDHAVNRRLEVVAY